MAMDNESSTQAQERKEKPLNELLTTAMVNIYVGPENTHWYIHERLLCYYSPFFSEIFYADDKKPQENQKARRDKTFGLPDDDDLAFEMFVGWLYSRNIKVPTEEKDLGPLIDLYLLSNKVGTDKLSQELVEAISHYYYQSQTYPSLRRVQYVYSNTEDDNEMREMMVGSVAKLLTTSQKIPAHWAAALQRNGQLAVDIIRSIQQWKLEEKTIPDARDRSSSRGRSDRNGFSAVERNGAESTETQKTNGTSNLGVESLNSDNGNDTDHTMEDSQMLKSEDSEAKPTPPPTYSTANSPAPSSSQFTTPNLALGTIGDPSQSNTNPIDEPKKPPDHPQSTILTTTLLEPPTRRGRSAVTFAEQVKYRTYTFFPSPLAIAPPTPPISPDPTKEGLALKPLSLVAIPDDQDVSTEMAKGPFPPASSLSPSPSPSPSSSSSRSGATKFYPSALRPAAQRSETVVLGFLWVLYFGWLASTGM